MAWFRKKKPTLQLKEWGELDAKRAFTTEIEQLRPAFQGINDHCDTRALGLFNIAIRLRALSMITAPPNVAHQLLESVASILHTNIDEVISELSDYLSAMNSDRPPYNTNLIAIGIAKICNIDIRDKNMTTIIMMVRPTIEKLILLEVKLYQKFEFETP